MISFTAFFFLQIIQPPTSASPSKNNYSFLTYLILSGALNLCHVTRLIWNDWQDLASGTSRGGTLVFHFTKKVWLYNVTNKEKIRTKVESKASDYCFLGMIFTFLWGSGTDNKNIDTVEPPLTPRLYNGHFPLNPRWPVVEMFICSDKLLGYDHESFKCPLFSKKRKTVRESIEKLHMLSVGL